MTMSSGEIDAGANSGGKREWKGYEEEEEEGILCGITLEEEREEREGIGPKNI